MVPVRAHVRRFRVVVCGIRQWLWVFVGDDVTVYLIADGRGYDQACMVLGADFCGVLERDGWAPYRRFEHASHQTCVAHLLRRCRELIADSVAGEAKVPHAVRRLLLDALAVRDQHAELLCARGENRDVIDTFLEQPGVQATNWRAEQAIRPAVLNRKHWGGNRTWHGADTQQILMSVIRTARQQHIDPVELMAGAQHARQPAPSELIKLPARASPTSLTA